MPAEKTFPSMTGVSWKSWLRYLEVKEMTVMSKPSKKVTSQQVTIRPTVNRPTGWLSITSATSTVSILAISTTLEASSRAAFPDREHATD